MKDDIQYYSDLTDHKNFVRLLWEGMTTNNGGFFFVSKHDDAFKNIDIPKYTKDEDIPKNTKDVKLIVSFESTKFENPEAIDGFNNFFMIKNDTINFKDVQKPLFVLIDNNE